MFFTEETLETHKRVEHAIVVPEAAVVDRDEWESNATETETNVTEADQLEPNGEPNDDSVPTRDEVKYLIISLHENFNLLGIAMDQSEANTVALQIDCCCNPLA